MKHSIRRTVLSVLGGLLLAFASAFPDARAAAAMLCGSRNDVAEDLAKNHGELPVSWGLIGNSHLIEVFVSPTGGFTIIVTRPDGLACVMAAGENWQPPTKRPKGGDT
ncbi:MAG: hypothetical protein IH994_07160 [Proteobacteria bacterium]|nr:hypothetical protein [Pseudomonadota bacterium]